MNPAATIVHVDLGSRSYDIQITSGRLGRCGESLAEFVSWTHAVVITDENVESLAMQVAESLAVHGDVGLLLVPPGETSKSVAMADELWQQLLELSADRRTLVVAVGGGVIGDLAGFVAATFARGLAFVQVPTTLLAQVDSSVGGKVAVNLPGAKNMVGAFWQPSHVLIDTAVLESLPPREFRAGLAEVIKYGVILDSDFFQHLEDQSTAILEHRADVLRVSSADFHALGDRRLHDRRAYR